MASFRPTRSSENPDVDYPPFDPGEWSGSGHLPIWSEVRHLEVTSRSIMIQGTTALREKFVGTFRSYRQATIEVK